MASMGVLSGIPAIHLTVSEFESLNEPARFYRVEQSNHSCNGMLTENGCASQQSPLHFLHKHCQEHVPRPLA